MFMWWRRMVEQNLPDRAVQLFTKACDVAEVCSFLWFYDFFRFCHFPEDLASQWYTMKPHPVSQVILIINLLALGGGAHISGFAMAEWWS